VAWVRIPFLASPLENMHLFLFHIGLIQEYRSQNFRQNSGVRAPELQDPHTRDANLMGTWGFALAFMVLQRIRMQRSGQSVDSVPERG